MERRAKVQGRPPAHNKLLLPQYQETEEIISKEKMRLLVQVPEGHTKVWTILEFLTYYINYESPFEFICIIIIS